jgi:hypothetical protein
MSNISNINGFNITAESASYAVTASVATSASFASTVPAAGVIGLNLSQIATGSVTASVSPTQFTVTSGSVAEFVVRGTGVTIGNAITDTHFITGSARITGSLTIIGPTTSTQIGAGAAPSGSIRLDVRAQGALSTDIALRVRNSTDTYNMLAVQGDGNIQIGSDAVGTTRTTTIAASNTSQLVLDTSFSTDTATISVARRVNPTYNTNAFLFTHNSFSDGNVQPYKFHYVNPSTYWGYTEPSFPFILDAGYMWFKDSATAGNLQMKLSPDNALQIYSSSRYWQTTANTTPIETYITGGFQIFASSSRGSSGGNTIPYIRTENGTLMWFGTQSRLFNVTASAITASNITAASLNVPSGSITITTGSITMPNRPAFRVTGAGGGKVAVTTLSGSYLNVDYQQGGGWDNATGTFTAPIAGLYQVNVVTRTNSNSLGTISQLIVYKNNTGGTTGTQQIMIEFGANTTMNHAGGSTISKLAVGDTLKMVVATGEISFDLNDNFSVAYIG